MVGEISYVGEGHYGGGGIAKLVRAAMMGQNCYGWVRTAMNSWKTCHDE